MYVDPKRRSSLVASRQPNSRAREFFRILRFRKFEIYLKRHFEVKVSRLNRSYQKKIAGKSEISNSLLLGVI